MSTIINIGNTSYEKKQTNKTGQLLKVETFNIAQLSSEIQSLAVDENMVNALRKCYSLFQSREIEFVKKEVAC